MWPIAPISQESGYFLQFMLTKHNHHKFSQLFPDYAAQYFLISSISLEIYSL